MVRQLEREVINKYSWLERANITSGYGINLLFDFADLDELCKDIEGELDSKALGAGFLSQGLRIDEFAEHRCSLLTYINDVLYDIDSYLEEPLYKGFNEAVDLMAAIDMTDGKTDNTLGVQKNVTVNGGGRGYGFEVELPELNLEDLKERIMKILRSYMSEIFLNMDKKKVQRWNNYTKNMVRMRM